MLIKTQKQPIRIITTGAMQTRFSIGEEIAITESTDSTVKVLYSRLLNAKNIDLNLQELQEGIAYIVNYIGLEGKLYLDVTPDVRVDELLKDGTEAEKYT